MLDRRRIAAVGACAQASSLVASHTNSHNKVHTQECDESPALIMCQ